MLLLAILLGTLIAGIGSVMLAALLSPKASSRFAPDMLGFAAGALLSTAFLHLLPEALGGDVDVRHICAAMLAGLMLFFVLDKAEFRHHAQAPAHPHAAAAPAHGPHHAGRGIWALLVGDSVHCFGDGLLIAAAFMADLQLGAMASLAVLTHEIPHHLGDLAVVSRGPQGRQRAATKVAAAGVFTVIGGLAGFALVSSVKPVLPYFLAAAASSFVYVALADLIPQLHKHSAPGRPMRHIAWLLLGIAVVALATQLDVD